MNIKFTSSESELIPWLEDSFDQLKKESIEGLSVSLGYERAEPADEFDDSIVFLEFKIIGAIEVTRPMSYSELVALRDFLSIVIKDHRKNYNSIHQ